MKSIASTTTSILILQCLGALRLTYAFTTAFFPPRNPLFHVMNKDESISSTSRIYLAPPPTEFLEQIQNIHHATQAFTESSDITQQLLSNTFLGIGGKQDVISQSAQLETLSTLKSVSSATAISPISTTNAAVTATASSPPFLIQNADPSDFTNPKLDAEQMEFYAQEFDIFAKLPLAALVYVVFDFFFFNAREAIDQNSLYLYDEEEYLENSEKDTPEQIMTFVGQNVFRLGMALAITYATVFASKMTYHPHF